MEKTYKTLKVILIALCFVALLLGAKRLYDTLGAGMEMDALMTQNTADAEAAKDDGTLPDITVYDAGGNAHKLSDFRGKPVILNFWASWCGPCKSEMPAFDETYQQYGDQIHFLMVNLTDGSQETVETASAYIADAGYSFPVYFDTDMDGATQYGVNAVPVTYLIDANGYLVAKGQGALSDAALQQGVDMLLAG